MSIKRDDIKDALEFEGSPRDVPPIHPGELLRREFLEPLEISQSRLASDLGVPFRRVHEIIHGKRGITAETAILLSVYFDTEPQFWLNLQSGYDLDCALEQMVPAIRRVRPRNRQEKSA